jgi:hypothetical protein
LNWSQKESKYSHGANIMSELTDKQQAAFDQVFSATSQTDFDKAIEAFAETLPQRSPDKRTNR